VKKNQCLDAASQALISPFPVNAARVTNQLDVSLISKKVLRNGSRIQ
jgi:hypothetical protein